MSFSTAFATSGSASNLIDLAAKACNMRSDHVVFTEPTVSDVVKEIQEHPTDRSAKRAFMLFSAAAA